MPYEDSDSGASMIDQRKYEEIIRPFYEFWKILGNYHNVTEEYHRRPTEDEVLEARKKFLEALGPTPNDGGWREIYENTQETQNYLDEFTREHYIMLLALAAEWQLDWEKDIEYNVFEQSLHYGGAALDLEPEYEQMLENSHEKRKEYVSRIANTHNQAQTSGQ